ncbi:hypothetical protein CHL78_005385 [Romboutsia weinsteinii]|uniref:Uncharacterized protein n=1 Tax=Romboutsia weinsteinii TaxID=2020949 RepID=A0A371J6G8_9FIRM|nr:hypothetical protein [Romboutsia weinsteinii]RDY28334.1 hypothetical protein CHL78_005385 [Romboutsia weinsteinii]
MSSKFLNWYSQALGSAIGLIACIYAYLNGDMFVYNNIGGNFDSLSFGGMLSSYTLFPLCILTLLLSIMKSYMLGKMICKISLDRFNMAISIITVIIGLLGTGVNFLIPSLLILLSPLTTLAKLIVHNFNEKSKDSRNPELASCSAQGDIVVAEECTENLNSFNKIESSVEVSSQYSCDDGKGAKNPIQEQMFDERENSMLCNENKKDKKYLARKNMAIDLINKDASIDFISDISGLTLDEISIIKSESNAINS